METERCPFYGIDCEYIPVAQKVSVYADEIERLREALKLILKINPYGDGQGYLMRGVAWNALQQNGSE